MSSLNLDYDERFVMKYPSLQGFPKVIEWLESGHKRFLHNRPEYAHNGIMDAPPDGYVAILGENVEPRYASKGVTWEEAIQGLEDQL